MVQYALEKTIQLSLRKSFAEGFKLRGWKKFSLQRTENGLNVIIQSTSFSFLRYKVFIVEKLAAESLNLYVDKLILQDLFVKVEKRAFVTFVLYITTKSS